MSLFVIQIPFLTTRLSSCWVDLITPVRASVTRPLIDSLIHDTIVTNNSIIKVIPLQLKSVKDAIDIATKEIRQNPPDIPLREEHTGFKINQKLLLVSLIAMTVLEQHTIDWMTELNSLSPSGL